MTAPKPRVLFLCTGNSCRSQMAEGWARALKSDVLDPCSAGIEAHGLNPLAVTVMAEVGIDITSHRSQPVDDLTDTPIDVVVTVCDHAHESCPVLPGAPVVVHHSFVDPPRAAAGRTDDEALEINRSVRDAIRDFIHTLPDALVAPH